MKTKTLVILLISISLLFIACDEDSITEAVLGTNTITLSGDISSSFDAPSMAGFIAEDSVFTMVMSPNINTDNYEDMLFLWKVSSALPTVGRYNVSFTENGGNGETDDGAFHGFFGVNDSTFYQMESGTVEITSSSSVKIEGTFDMSGAKFNFDLTTSGELNVVGKFSTVPLSN